MTRGLEVEQLCKSYGAHVVLDGVSLSVPQGQLVCFLGPSGSGKTTLLRIIAGLERPERGRVLMYGQDITQMPAHERNFAMVFQSLALFPFLTVEENIAYSLRLRNVPPRERRARVRELLELIRLPDLGRRRVDHLSGGQRQRVAIARALAQEPRLFLLDEPLSSLDARLRDHMQIELRLLQQKLAITTIVVTHDQREAMTLADTVVVFADGRVQQIGSPTEIYRRPANRFVAGFFGQSNLLQAEVLDAEHVRVLGRVLQVTPLPAGITRGDAVTLSLRPEDIRVLPAGRLAGESLPGHLRFARSVGERVELRIDCEGQEIVSTARAADWPVMDCGPVDVELVSGAGTVLTA